MKKPLKCTMFAALVCMLLLALLPASALAADWDSHWSAEYIRAALDNGWIEAAEDGSVPAGEPVTRGQFAVILWKALGSPAALTDCPFEDVETDAGTAAVTALAERGVVEGVGGKSFSPGGVITRQEGVTMLARAYSLNADGFGAAAGFADWADTAVWARDSLAAAVEQGVVNGVGGNRLAPAQSITLGEAVKLAAIADRVGTPAAASISADNAVKGVTAIGIVDTDGTKVSAIAVEYGFDLTGAQVSADDYDVEVYKPESSDYLVGYDNIGTITKVYVNDQPDVSAEGGSGAGNYVILEVSTDYVRTSDLDYLSALAAGVTQKGAIQTDRATVAASDTKFVNYTVSIQERPDFMGGGTVENHTAEYGKFIIKGLDEYQIYGTSTYDGYWKYLQDGDAWVEKDCFNEKSGETYDYELGYALWVPGDYDPDGSYALVTVDHTITGDPSPYEALLTNYGPTYFISDEAQQIVKDAHDLDGMIVVVPLIIERVDDNSCVPAMWMALCGLWDHLQEEYSIDPNYIYGAGQSMGGMLLMQTNTNRDNYFAGMLCYGNQWGQNYYKDAVFARGMGGANYNETAENTPRHYPSTASNYYIWDYHFDENGEKVYEDHDPYNFYYLISDDNLMVFNGSSNALSIGLWGEMSQLYTDLVGYSIPHLTGLDGMAPLDEQNQMVNDFLAAGNDFNGVEMGLWECSWDGNGNDGTAIWSRTITANYEWLLQQSRADEMARPKLDINREFVPAEVQLQDEAHTLVGFYDKDTGEQLYYWTAQAGSGTRFYNSSCLPTGFNNPADLNPGWLPDGMSWETGVQAASIRSIQAIGSDGQYTAVAVEYDVDMEYVQMHLVGDAVVNSRGEAYDDYFVTNPPFDFYDADGSRIDCRIVNYYVNDTASARAGAERGSGSGRYVIVEFETPVSVKPVGAIQRTTVITDTAISSATSKLYS